MHALKSRLRLMNQVKYSVEIVINARKIRLCICFHLHALFVCFVLIFTLRIKYVNIRTDVRYLLLCCFRKREDCCQSHFQLWQCGSVFALWQLPRATITTQIGLINYLCISKISNFETIPILC